VAGGAPRPGPPPARRPPESTLAYQTETGGRTTIAPRYDALGEDLKGQIHAVAEGVIESFLASSTPTEQAEVLGAKPSIRPDLDRSLLVDLAHRLDNHDLSDPIRFELRDHFWAVLSKAVAPGNPANEPPF
jgi:hypothetical protein